MSATSRANVQTGFERLRFTIGAAGPAGPTGPTGPVGPVGPKGPSLDVSCNDIIDVSNIFFCNNTAILGSPALTLTISGNIDVFTSNSVENLRVNDTNFISIPAGTEGLPAINFNLASVADPNTGIYQWNTPLTDRIGFSAGGTTEASISSNHLHLVAGAAGGAPPSVPSINFGLIGNFNTGMFRIDTGTIGFCTGGVEKASIYPSPGAGNFIEGLNVGLTTDIAGIRRLSATAANSWEDGNCGNSSALVFTGSDFTNWDLTAAAPDPFSVGPNRFLTAPLGFIMGNVAGLGGHDITSVKLLPKGFRVPDSATVQVTSTDGFAAVWGDAARIEVFSQDLSVPLDTPTLLGLGTIMNVWAGGVNTQYSASLGPSDTGNGSLTIVVNIFMPNTQQITNASALVSVTVPIERI